MNRRLLDRFNFGQASGVVAIPLSSPENHGILSFFLKVRRWANGTKAVSCNAFLETLIGPLMRS